MSDLYAQRGVSAQKEDVHFAIKGLDHGLFPNTFCKILPDTLTGSPDHACIMHADTAGTKSILAYLYWKETGDLSVWKGIAQDAIVMNIDDMICSGAVDRFVLSSTIARNKNRIPKEVLAAVIQGCEEVLAEWRQAGLHIDMAGGETADVGDLVQTIDVGYTAFARLAKSDVIQVNPQPGDVIVGFASFGQATYESAYNSGMGCNGLTSARHDMLSKYYAEHYPESYDTTLPDAVCYIGKHRLTDAGEQGRNIGQLLLSPTRTFAPLMKQVLAQHRAAIRGIIHNTGGAQSKCLKYIPGAVRLVKNNLFEPPFIFNRIQEAAGTSYHEMYQVFNMGTRLELYTDASTADAIVALAKQFNIDARVVGHVESAESKSVEVRTKHGTFIYS